MKANRSFRRTTLIMLGFALFLFGLISIRAFGSQISMMVGFAIFIVLLGFLRHHKRAFIATSLLTLSFCLGLVRGGAYVQKIAGYQEAYGKQVTLTIKANEDAVYSERRQLIFTGTHVNIISPVQKKLPGNIQVEGFGTPMIYKGDTLAVTGKLYPKRGDNIAGITFADIRTISVGQSKIDIFRRKFSTGLQNVLPEPLASLGLGILIGQRSTLPDDLQEQLREVSLIHIVAVSGYNLTVIIYFSQRLLAKRSRFQAFVFSNTLIVLFLLVTGFSPSIVRAAVVSGISLVMWYFGRRMKPLMILLIAAVLTAGWNPLYIWSSIGWYLSFAAFFGVLVLAPLLHAKLVPRRLHDRLLPQIVTETFAAQICTIPILLFIFSTLSIIGIVANVLVVPIIPFVMLSTLIAGMYGIVGPFLLGGVLVIPARIMLSYIVEVTRLLSRVPHASVEVTISATQTVVLCSIIIGITLLLARSQRQLTSKKPSHIV